MPQRHAAAAEGAREKPGPVAAFLIFSLLAGCAASPTIPMSIPVEFSVEEHELTRSPEAEYSELFFAEGTQAEILARHAEERSNLNTFMNRSCTVAEHFGLCASQGEDKLVAWEEYGSGIFASGNVTLTRNGSPIYKIPIGDSSPISALRGLWTYDGHWALETAYIQNHQLGNEIDSQATGQISVDGQLINKQLGYQEAFGFQTMHGNPFYFFKQKGKIGLSYDGVEIATGYDEVPHYGCCSAATLNPGVYENMVAFFARKGSTWYYIEAGVFDASSSPE